MASPARRTICRISRRGRDLDFIVLATILRKQTTKLGTAFPSTFWCFRSAGAAVVPALAFVAAVEYTGITTHFSARA